MRKRNDKRRVFQSGKRCHVRVVQCTFNVLQHNHKLSVRQFMRKRH